jgi:hypothetical protein
VQNLAEEFAKFRAGPGREELKPMLILHRESP